jgi:hypothetical protein
MAAEISGTALSWIWAAVEEMALKVSSTPFRVERLSTWEMVCLVLSVSTFAVKYPTAWSTQY